MTEKKETVKKEAKTHGKNVSSAKKPKVSSEKVTKKKTNKVNKKKDSTTKIVLAVIILAIILAVILYKDDFTNMLNTNKDVKTENYNNIELKIVENDGRLQITYDKAGTFEITDEDLEAVDVFYQLEGYTLEEEELINQTIIRKILFNNAQEFVQTDSAIEEQNDAMFENVDPNLVQPQLDVINITFDELKNLSERRLKEDMAIQEYLNSVILPYAGTEKSVNASHILICWSDLATCDSNRTKEEAEEFANEVLAMTETEEFDKLAESYSDGPSATNGGALGLFTAGMMVPEFETAAFALEEGEISDIVETQFGYHIIKVHNIEEVPSSQKANELQYALFEKILNAAYE